LPTVRKTLVLAESDGSATVRAYPKPDGRNGALQESLFELAVREKWKLAELRTEEGRMDEVFRSITLPDTMAAANKKEESK
jgi:ABC-2 type transport system ATP-binding protein